MTTPISTTMTPDARRDMHLWCITLEWLFDEADPDGQLAALRCFAKLPDAELPIRSIADVVLTATSDEDGSLYFQDTDALWKEGMGALRRATLPVSLDLEMIVNSLTLAFACDTSTDQMLEFIG